MTVCPSARRRGHEQVLRARDRYGLAHDARASEAIGLGADVTIFDLNVRAHRAQTIDVNIHRTRADGAATGQRHIGLAEASQQRPEHDDRCAHRAHQFVGRDESIGGGGIDLDPHAVVDGHAHAHATEQLDHGRDVLQMRHVAHRHRPLGQQRRGQNRQRGVLRAGDANLALERRAALNQQLVHGLTFVLRARTPGC